MILGISFLSLVFQALLPSFLIFLIFFNYLLKKSENQFFVFPFLAGFLFDFFENNFLGTSWFLLGVSWLTWFVIGRIFNINNQLKFFLLTTIMISLYLFLKFFIIFKYPIEYFGVLFLKNLFLVLILIYG